MRIEYSKRAISDLKSIGRYYRDSAGSAVAAAVESRIRQVVARVARAPQTGRPIVQRPGVRVVLLLRYPYKVFYRVLGASIRIVHIRHTSRRPWEPG
jgi:toxin ParE1/3/4